MRDNPKTINRRGVYIYTGTLAYIFRISWGGGKFYLATNAYTRGTKFFPIFSVKHFFGQRGHAQRPPKYATDGTYVTYDELS